MEVRMVVVADPREGYHDVNMQTEDLVEEMRGYHLYQQGVCPFFDRLVEITKELGMSEEQIMADGFCYYYGIMEEDDRIRPSILTPIILEPYRFCINGLMPYICEN